MARGGLVAAMAALAVALVLSMAPEASAAVEFSDRDLATEDSAWALYELWIAHHKVARDDGAEKTRRFRVFKNNLLRVREFHERDRSYKLAMNNFGDMTDDEVSAAYDCEDLPGDDGGEDQDQDQGGFAVPAGNGDEPPEEVDWRDTGYDQRPAAVTDVKNQGPFCKCCWAFAAVAAVEGIFSIRRKVLTSLSEQQLVDCDTLDRGCRGGWAGRAFSYITNTGGLAGEASYPYTGRNGSCHKAMSPFVQLNGRVRVKPLSEIDLRKAVAAQPIAVSVDTGKPGIAFKRYTGGIFRGPCGSGSSNTGGHAMTLVGYGTTESGEDYWILKNSWGAKWGEHGYMRLKRDTHGIGTPATSCGILRHPVYPMMH